MKLYLTPGACSLASHIALRELGLSFETEKVDLATKKTASGADFTAVNPKGYVPTLEVDEGVLTENVAVLQYIADLQPESGLAPAPESFERYRLLEWLAFINSEIHKGYKPYFDPTATDQEKARASEKLGQRLAYVEPSLDGKSFLMGEQFTVADAYLYTVLTWAPIAGLDLARWPNTQAYFRRVGERPAVQAAQEAERAA